MYLEQHPIEVLAKVFIAQEVFSTRSGKAAYLRPADIVRLPRLEPSNTLWLTYEYLRLDRSVPRQ